MRHITGRLGIAAALAAGALVVACSGDGTGLTTVPPNGTVVVQLTDAPFPFDSVKSVDVFIVRVDAKLADTDSAQADANTSDADRNANGWTTIAEPKAKFDLLTLQAGKLATLGQAPLPAGSYRGFRIVIDPAQSAVTLTNGQVVDVKWPSAGRSGIKVNLDKPLAVTAGATTTLVVDFDVSQSFVMRGNAMKNGLLFKPVLRGTVQ
jgi:hypothetical protein